MTTERSSAARMQRVLWVLAASAALSGCAAGVVGGDDSACARELQAVQRTAQAARAELARGVTAEDRQESLSRMVDAASRARQTCGYDVPGTNGSRRARQPKAG